MKKIKATGCKKVPSQQTTNGHSIRVTNQATPWVLRQSWSKYLLNLRLKLIPYTSEAEKVTSCQKY